MCQKIYPFSIVTCSSVPTLFPPETDVAGADEILLQSSTEVVRFFTETIFLAKLLQKHLFRKSLAVGFSDIFSMGF